MKRGITAVAAIGNILEFYDFFLFGLLIPFFSASFFPADDPSIALLKSYGLFAAGFLTRPFGGLFLGFLGDRWGRKYALNFSLFGMAIATMAIGLLPGYASIGIAAPILLLCCRLLQGICTGGEYSGSGLLVMEHAVGEAERYSSTATIAASATLGGALASGVCLLFLLLPLPEWSWRLPFLVGGSVGLVGLYLRQKIPETGSFVRANYLPLRIFSEHWRACLCTVGIGGLAVGPFYLVMVYLPSYLSTTLGFSRVTVLVFHCALSILCAIAGTAMGQLSKRYNVLKMMYIGIFFIAIFAWPVLYIVTDPVSSIYLIFAATLFWMVGSELFSVFSLGFIAQSFPVTLRYRGTSFFYNSGVALFCGTIPLISKALTDYLHLASAPAFYIIALCLLGLAATYYGRPHFTKD